MTIMICVFFFFSMHFTVLNSAEKKKRRFGTTRLNMSPAGTVPDPDGTRARAGSWWPKRTPSVGWAVGISLSVHVFFFMCIGPCNAYFYTSAILVEPQTRVG